MIDTLFQITLSVSISMVAATVAAKVLVELIDIAGYCWNGPREAKRHRDDSHRPMPARPTPPFELDITNPIAIRQAMLSTPAHHPTPLADRVRRQRVRRLEAIAGRPMEPA